MDAVVFDMDGLMFNSEDVYTLAGSELLRRRGREFTAELKDAMMGLPPRASFEIMIRRHGLTESWDVLARESNEIFLALLPDQLAMMPGLVELLDALEKAGIPKAIATSSGRQLTDACLAPFDLAPAVPVRAHVRGHHPRQAASGGLSDGGPAIRRAARRGCSCWRTVRTAAGRQRRRARWSWPCPASTAGGTISASPRW